MRTRIIGKLLILACFSSLVIIVSHFLTEPSSGSRKAVSVIERPVFERNGGHVTDRRPSKLLIVTYMRSGSTLTADILQQAPDVFYVFEPLHRLADVFEKNRSHVKLANNTYRRLQGMASEYHNYLVNWFQCELSGMDIRTMTDPFLPSSLSMQSYWDCLTIRRRIANETTPLDVQFCSRVMEDKCRSATSRHIKTIRIPMAEAGFLMETFPDLKVIHLIRDPRAVLLSQMILNKEQVKFDVAPGGNIGRFCNRVYRDVVESEKLFQTFPGRIGRVYYEDIAKNPVDTTIKMYEFLGLDLSQKVLSYVENITVAGQDQVPHCFLCTTRKNSTASSQRWRKNMKIIDVKKFDNVCKKLYAKLKFLTFRTEKHLRNTSNPSRKPFYTTIDIKR